MRFTSPGLRGKMAAPNPTEGIERPLARARVALLPVVFEAVAGLEVRGAVARATCAEMRPSRSMVAASSSGAAGRPLYRRLLRPDRSVHQRFHPENSKSEVMVVKRKLPVQNKRA